MDEQFDPIVYDSCIYLPTLRFKLTQVHVYASKIGRDQRAI